MALENGLRFLARQRVGNVMKIDARDKLRRRHVGKQLPHGLCFGLAIEIPDGVDDCRQREVNDALFGTKPSQLRLAGQTVPETSEIGGDVAEIVSDDEMTERFDGRRAHLVAAANRERQAVTFEPSVRLENHIRRGVIGIGMHGIRAHLIPGCGKAKIEHC